MSDEQSYDVLQFCFFDVYVRGCARINNAPDNVSENSVQIVEKEI